MRDSNRIFPFCNKFAAFWQTYIPDFRFWQAVKYVAGFMSNDYYKRDPFYAEESDWEQAIAAAEKFFEETS